MKLLVRPVPKAVYKVPCRFARAKRGDEEFSFWFQVLGGEGRQVRSIKGRLRLYSGRALIEEIDAPPAFWASRIQPSEIVGRPGIYMLHFRTPCAAGVDKLTIRLEVVCDRERLTRGVTVPIRRYEPKPLLLVPIEGGAFVFADHTARHGAEAGWFALDLLGLGPDQRLCRRDPPQSPRDYYGFGKKVLAPAPGTVVRTCDGIADHKRLGDQLSRPERQGLWKRNDWHLFGNHVVIGHAANCYSLLAHLKHGSVCVLPGQKLRAGDVVGRLGHSGVSRLPHLHFQLMAGPDAFTSDPLPAYFGPVLVPPFGRFESAVLPAGTVVTAGDRR